MPRVAVPMVPRYNELAEVCSLHRLFVFFSKAQRAIGRLGGNKKARAGTGNEREIELRKSSGVTITWATGDEVEPTIYYDFNLLISTHKPL